MRRSLTSGPVGVGGVEEVTPSSRARRRTRRASSGSRGGAPHAGAGAGTSSRSRASRARSPPKATVLAAESHRLPELPAPRCRAAVAGGARSAARWRRASTRRRPAGEVAEEARAELRGREAPEDHGQPHEREVVHRKPGEHALVRALALDRPEPREAVREPPLLAAEIGEGLAVVVVEAWKRGSKTSWIPAAIASAQKTPSSPP